MGVVAPVPMSMIRLWGHRAATIEQQRHQDRQQQHWTGFMVV